MKIRIYLLIILGLFSCSDRDDRLDDIRCGEVVRLWAQNTSYEDGNPCGNNSNRFTIRVENKITKNLKDFCVNYDEFSRYDLGDEYCDDYDPNGW
tara:strand:+ start:259 stop:543 length:285 start_codon:yes stop_codon:yes gene_type:complete